MSPEHIARAREIVSKLATDVESYEEARELIAQALAEQQEKDARIADLKADRFALDDEGIGSVDAAMIIAAAIRSGGGHERQG